MFQLPDQEAEPPQKSAEGPSRPDLGRQFCDFRAVAYPASTRNGNRELALGDGVTIAFVKSKPPSFSRRKLSAVVRKAITSYYTADEQQEIAQAAKRERISLSSFVATASLSEARRGNRKH